MRIFRLCFGLVAAAVLLAGPAAFAVHVQPDPAAIAVASLPDLVTQPLALFVVKVLAFMLLAVVIAAIGVEIVHRLRAVFARRAEPDDGFGLDTAWRVPDPPS